MLRVTSKELKMRISFLAAVTCLFFFPLEVTDVLGHTNSTKCKSKEAFNEVCCALQRIKNTLTRRQAKHQPKEN